MGICRPRTCSATENARTGIEIARNHNGAKCHSISCMHKADYIAPDGGSRIEEAEDAYRCLLFTDVVNVPA